jgi:heme oxygenase
VTARRRIQKREAVDAGRRGGLAEALREATRPLDAQAKRSGIVGGVRQGRASRRGYALLLRNLLPVYRVLEDGLERHRHAPGLRLFAWRALYRATALEADLEAIGGLAWEESLPLLPEGEAYTSRVAAAAEGAGPRLIAHAYARYLGDLSRGQAMRKVLARSLGLGPEALSFYAFPAVTDPERFEEGIRDALDRAAPEIDDVPGLIAEAAQAVRLDIALAEAVLRAAEAATG